MAGNYTSIANNSIVRVDAYKTIIVSLLYTIYYTHCANKLQKERSVDSKNIIYYQQGI